MMGDQTFLPPHPEDSALNKKGAVFQNLDDVVDVQMSSSLHTQKKTKQKKRQQIPAPEPRPTRST